MDEEKDKRKEERSLQQNQLSTFIDARKIQTQAFGENKMGERAYRRAERIALALTLITNRLPEQDELRKRIRDRGAGLLSAILDARSEMRSVNSQKVETIKASVREIVSMVRMLGIAGSISLQNADILIEALDELGTFIGLSQRSSFSDTVHLSKEELSDVQSVPVSIKDITDKNIIKDKKQSQESVLYKTSKHEPRSAGILEALRGTVAMGTRELAANFPEYSEKMIQRELADLIGRGMVKKIGFKRWSKYALLGVDPVVSESTTSGDIAVSI